MKKLLSILTISTLATSVPTPLSENTLLTRAKRHVGTTTKDVTNKTKEINGSHINLKLITSVPMGTKISGADRNRYLKLIENDTWYLYKKILKMKNLIPIKRLLIF